MLKKTTICFAFMFTVLANPLFTSGSPVGSFDERLVDHISIALSHNPLILEANEKIEANRNFVSQAGTWSDPGVSVSYANLPVNTFNFNQEPMTAFWLNVEQKIPLTRINSVKTENAEINVRIAQLNKQRFELAAAEMIAHKWFDRAYLQIADMTTDKNIGTLNNIIDIALQKYETGGGSQLDVLRGQIKRSRLMDMKAQILAKIQTMQQEYLVQMGLDPDSLLEIPANLPPSFPVLNQDDLEELMFNQNPAWKMTALALQSSESMVKLKRKQWVPDLKVGAGYGFRQDADNGSKRPDFFTLKAGVSVPLFGRLKQGAAVQEVMAKARSAEQAQRKTELELKMKLRKLIEEDKKLGDQILIYNEGIIPQAEAVLSTAMVSYATGEAGFQILMTMESEIYNARLEQMERTRDRHKVRASLAVLIGGDNLIMPDQRRNSENE